MLLYDLFVGKVRCLVCEYLIMVRSVLAQVIASEVKD